MSTPVLHLYVAALAHDGRGIGFLPEGDRSPRGLAVFVERALPGQTIACEQVRDRGSYLEARLLEVLASDFIPEPPHCPHQAQCGGCPLQPLPYHLQLQWKEKLAGDAMLRIGKLSGPEFTKAWEGIRAAPVLRNYRNKVTLAFGKNCNGHLALGLRQQRSHTVLPFERCVLIDESAYPIIAIAAELTAASGLPFSGAGGFWRFLTLRLAAPAPAAHPQWHAILHTGHAGKPQRAAVAAISERLLAENAELASFTHEEHRGKGVFASGAVRRFTLAREKTFAAIYMELGNRLFGLDVGSFFQVNRQASPLLAALALDMDAEASGGLLDLYCGVGAPGQLLAERHESSFGIEQDCQAVKWAARNASAAGLPGWKYACGDVASKLRELAHTGDAGKFQTILLDPPRAGLGQDGMENIAALAPQHVIYISCNPSTMARDAQALREEYSLERLAAVDMFPHTPHLECCGLWRRRKS